MTQNTEQKRELLLKRSLHTIRILKENEQAANEPVAVIGMSCRFPGGCTTPEAFWNFLKEKGDGVTDIPPDRWDIDEFYDPNPGVPGKMYIRQANFLQEDVGEFDAKFFRISPLEASEMDPQQRLLLEVSWESLERAGQNIDQLKESNTGVFIGIIGSDYSRLPRDTSKISPYRGTGSIPSIASGRISHILGFHGPALSVDTTCSSSLVSVQLACDSLKKRKCDMALAGGTNMMLSPYPMISLCMMNALSQDGRCRPFDAAGKGYGRAEGCGVVVLKRLSVAQKAGDPILAVIRSATVNHDGSSSGLTVPNGNAQRELILDALADAGISGEDVSFLEAHGTGTSLGDPIEIKAVTESLGRGRSPENPLIIGSVKGNVGHLEGAAGISGLIKVVLCLQHKEIPPNINLDTPNPMIRFEKIPASVPSEVTPWHPVNGKPRIAGISSFGFSGTNAHVILSETPKAEKTDRVFPERPLSVLTLSAKSDNALNRLANAYQEHLQANPGINISDLCHTANACRSHFSHRLALVGRDMTQINDLLNTFTAGQKNGHIFKGETEDGTRPKIAFFFTDSTDIPGLTREMYDTLPGFREKIELCASLFEPYLRCSLLEWLYPETPDKALSCPDRVKEACLFSVGYAMSALLQSYGILPDAVWGQKTGNYAAACAAGILSPETAILHISGNWDNLSEATCSPPQCRFISPDSGKPVKKKELSSPAYWRQSFNSSIAPEKIVAELNGYRFFMIFGQEPEPILQAGEQRRILRIRDEYEALLQSLGELYCSGADIQWREFDRDQMTEKILLPTYPFERKRYWSPLKPSAAQQAGTKPVTHPHGGESDPLEGSRLFSPLNKNRFEYGYDMNPENLPEIKDTHDIFHVGYCQEVLCRAIKQSFHTASYIVKKTDFISALILSGEEKTSVHLILKPGQDDEIAFKFYSRSADSDRWDLHISGIIALNRRYEFPERSPEFFGEIKKRCPENCSGPAFYHQLQKRGIQLGPSVQWVEEIWYREGETLARFRKASGEDKRDSYGLQLHPGIFDACAQIFHAALWKDVPDDMRFMVVKWTDFVCAGDPGDGELWCHVVLDKEASRDGFVSGRFDLFDSSGKPVATSGENRMKGLSGYSVRELKKIRDKAGSQQKGVNKELAERLGSASAEQKETILTDYFRETVSKILDMSLPDISVKDSLRNMGMDSMTGLQFKTTVEHELDIDIPIEDIIEGPSISELGHSAADSLQASSRRDTGHSKNKESISHSKTGSDLWFAHRKINPDAKVRLFCLPYGVGGASLYRQWQDAFPEYIEVCPIQLPGRENRLKEKPIHDINEMTDTLERVVQPELDRPYALYGHSMGALIAFRLAYRLWRSSEIRPVHLFVGGFTSPLIYPNPYMKKIVSRYQAAGFKCIPNLDQTDKSSIEKVKKAVRESPELKMIGAENDELTEAVLPMIVSDTKIVESYKPEKEEIFDTPITAFHGSNDDRVSSDEIVECIDHRCIQIAYSAWQPFFFT